LAKTLFLSQEKTIIRKIKEAILAVQLERRYTKDELLALYLNQIYFGSGAYGVESAARLFFGKPASQMDLAQCATDRRPAQGTVQIHPTGQSGSGGKAAQPGFEPHAETRD
jgi:membrane carboxypeptidase/penicillin-binding protein